MSKFTKEEVLAKINAIMDNGGYITFPEGFEDIASDNGELRTGYNSDNAFPTGYPYKCRVYRYSDDTYLNIEGNFGTDDDGYCIGEQEALGDEHIMALLLVDDVQKQKMAELDALEAAIDQAVKAYEDFSSQNHLGAEVEWSTDPSTIADWNSSRC